MVGCATLAAAITDSYSGPLALSAAITSTTATTITVTSVGWLATSGAGSVILIGSELMTVTGIAGTTITVERGTPTSTAATHLITAAIYPATDLTISAGISFFAVGAAIQIDTGGSLEQVIVATAATTSGVTAMWVGRGANGTTPVTHLNGASLFPTAWLYQYTSIAFVTSPTQFITQNYLSNAPSSMNFSPTIVSEVAIPSGDQSSYTASWSTPVFNRQLPFEMAASLVSAVADVNPGGQCILWLNLPTHISDDGIAGVMSRVIPNLSSGVQLIAQCGNELFNSGFVQYITITVLGAIAPNPFTSSYGFPTYQAFGAYRQNHMTQQCKAAFTAAGLNPSRVLSLQACWCLEAGDGEAVVSACQTYGFPIDYLCFAPYVAVPTAAAPTMLSWWPSVIGGSAEWSGVAAADRVALWRHLIMSYLKVIWWFSEQEGAWSVFNTGRYLSQYNRGYVVGDTGGQTTNTTNSGIGKVCFYEASPLSPGLPTGSSTWQTDILPWITGALLRDIIYDPAMYATEQAWIASIQQQAYQWGLTMPTALVPNPRDLIPAFLCYYADEYGFAEEYSHYGAMDEDWTIYAFQGQKRGYGNGTGTASAAQGVASNVMGLTTSTYDSAVSNGLAEDAVVFDYANDSVRGQAIADWNASIVSLNGSIPSPHSSCFGLGGLGVAAWNASGVVLVPTKSSPKKRWFPGLRRPVARMRLGR